VELGKDIAKVIGQCLAAIEAMRDLVEVDPATVELGEKARLCQGRAGSHTSPQKPLPREVGDGKTGKARLVANGDQLGFGKPNGGKM
jgi:hypothetical protein